MPDAAIAGATQSPTAAAGLRRETVMRLERGRLARVATISALAAALEVPASMLMARA